MRARMVFTNRQRLALDYDRFSGGIFNPSLAIHAGAMWGLARCEPHDQAERNADQTLNFLPPQAVLFRLDESFTVTEAHYDLQFENFPELPWRAEDYRLFVFQNRLYCTHTLWVQGYNLGMGLSLVNLREHTITLINPIQLHGVSVQPVEKNWVMIPDKHSLHCLYSFFPEYILTKISDLETAQFEFQDRIVPGFLSNSLENRLVSNSTVPQRKGDYWWMLVHQKNAEHVYHDYLVQLDAASLRPVQISSHPVISGGDCEGFWRGFLTVYSLLINDDQVIVSFGEGDRYAGVATASITEFTATPMQPLRSA